MRTAHVKNEHSTPHSSGLFNVKTRSLAKLQHFVAECNASMNTDAATFNMAQVRRDTESLAFLVIYISILSIMGVNLSAQTHTQISINAYACTRLILLTPTTMWHTKLMQVIKDAMHLCKQRVPLIMICGGLMPVVPYNVKKVRNLT